MLAVAGLCVKASAPYPPPTTTTTGRLSVLILLLPPPMIGRDEEAGRGRWRNWSQESCSRVERVDERGVFRHDQRSEWRMRSRADAALTAPHALLPDSLENGAACGSMSTSAAGSRMTLQPSAAGLPRPALALRRPCGLLSAGSPLCPVCSAASRSDPRLPGAARLRPILGHQGA